MVIPVRVMRVSSLGSYEFCENAAGGILLCYFRASIASYSCLSGVGRGLLARMQGHVLLTCEFFFLEFAPAVCLSSLRRRGSRGSATGEGFHVPNIIEFFHEYLDHFSFWLR